VKALNLVGCTIAKLNYRHYTEESHKLIVLELIKYSTYSTSDLKEIRILLHEPLFLFSLMLHGKDKH
jgi:hypothetical protein